MRDLTLHADGDVTLASYALSIPAPDRLLSINAERRLHHMDRARIVQAWRWAAKIEARRQRIPAFESCTITAHVYQARGKLADCSNHLPVVKACIDGGLIDARVLQDDSGEHVTKLVFLAPQRGPDEVRLVLTGVLA